MDMNDKDWEENEEFWDNEIEDDDEDDYNGMDGNVDANNDETFDNAAEWNEDEHEEMIARDLIPLHNQQRGGRNINSNSNNTNSHNNNNNVNSHASTNNNSRSVINPEMSPNNCRNLMDETITNSNNGMDAHQHFALLAATLEPSTGHTGNWNSAPTNNENIFAQMKQRSAQDQPRSSTSNDLSWQDAIGTSRRLQLLQLQQQAQEQLRLLSQSRQILLDQEQSRMQQMNEHQRRIIQQRQSSQQQSQDQSGSDNIFVQLDRSAYNQGQSTQKPVSQPKVLTVDELERQFLKTSINQNDQQPRTTKVQIEPSKRAGWSPFGGKDLFKTDDPMILQGLSQLDPSILQSIQPQAITLEQHRLILEQQKLFQHQLQQLAIFKQQQQHQQHQQQQQQQEQQQQQRQQQRNQKIEPRLMPPNAQCFTVEELERQMMANRSSSSQQSEIRKKVSRTPEPQEKAVRNESTRQSDENRHRNFQDRRNGERNDRYDRHNRDSDARDHHRDRRDNKNHRDHNRQHRKEPTIIPPQVQLGVIERAKRMHSITAMHSDEFIQDRMPTSSDGFRFMRHTKIADVKGSHDGVLTDKERDWLTRIQEKIQADYDDNIDQDYYYLLYFNRSSMTDEEAQKPTGPGVFDRRFIPRERLLYNSGI